MENEDKIIQDMAKNKGLAQVLESELVDLAVNDTLAWSQLWGSVKKMDVDNNGFLDKNDFDNLFKDFYAKEMEGKSFY